MSAAALISRRDAVAGLVGVGACLATQPSRAQSAITTLPPPGIPRDRGVAAFIQALQQTIAYRDVAGLIRLSAPDIALSYAGDSGHATLKRWFTTGEMGDLWTELEDISRYPPELGRDADGAYLSFPYWFARWPESLDPYEHVLTSANCPIQAEPSFYSRMLDVVSYAVLRSGKARYDDPYGWRRVVTAQGGEAWAPTSMVFYPLGWRAIAAPGPQGWRISAFLTGD